ncbi:MAG: ABC-2 type transport system ATP-binding protein [Candidatus Omnitrophota bacterium]|jgi:ABC-2 type transport system ATP-binding protein
MSCFVDIQNLGVRYGTFDAVKDLSLQIPKGSVFGFIGPNGAGKTSTIKVLATLQKPYQGKAMVGGVDVTEDPQAVRKMIGYMPDFFGVYEDLTAREYLHFFAAAYRIDRNKRDAIVKDVLSLTDLVEKIDSPVDALSRGMKQRLGLARVLLHDPELLLLDEPASGLDPRARIEIRELLKELMNMGKTILISSHILHELSEYCTQIGIVEQGKLVASGSLDEIYRTLSLKRLIHVQIVEQPDGLLDQIRAIPGVSKAEQETDRMAVYIEEDLMAPCELLTKIHGLGAKVHMFQPEAMDMETVFMKLTEGKTQ